MLQVLIALLVIFAQDAPMTDLTISGARTIEFTNSDTNACYFEEDDNTFNAQLTDATSGMIISLHVLGTPGDHPALNQLTALSLDGPEDDPFVNWSASGGTVTLDDVAADVPIEGGDPSVSASTHGVLGHIDSDLTSKQGSIHISGQFACHSP